MHLNAVNGFNNIFKYLNHQPISINVSIYKSPIYYRVCLFEIIALRKILIKNFKLFSIKKPTGDTLNSQAPSAVSKPLSSLSFSVSLSLSFPLTALVKHCSKTKQSQLPIGLANSWVYKWATMHKHNTNKTNNNRNKNDNDGKYVIYEPSSRNFMTIHIYFCRYLSTILIQSQ